MAQRKITTGGIANDAITTDLLGDNLELQGNYVKVPVGDTASRPSGEAGVMRFNTDTNSMEQYDGTAWVSIAKPPIISSLSYPGSQTAVSPDGGETITISGTNFTTGVNVKFGTTYATSVTRTNSTSLSVVVPALTAATYDVIVENSDGMQATLSGGLESNAAPVFTTAAGSLGSIQNDQTISTITIVATEEDSGAITYGVTTGALPTGLTLSGANIGGAPTGYTAETTVNFTITATDDEGQTVDRAFSLTVLVGFYSLEISNSIMLEKSDGDLLNYTPSSGNTTTWTQSFWFKLGLVGGSLQTLFSATNQFRVDIDNNSKLRIYGYSNGTLFSSGNFDYLFRDPGSWYNLCIRVDTTQGTKTDRMKVWINGDEIPLEGEAFPTYLDFPNQNDASGWMNSSYEHFIGANNGSANCRISFAEWHCIDGQSKSPTDFGETKNGVWIPKEYTGTYGTNGFYLDFEGSFQNDKSGNGNNWGISGNLGGANQRIDSPTVNFNALSGNNIPSGLTVNEANLKGEFSAYTNSHCVTNIAFNSGKWYWEWIITSSGSTWNVRNGVGDAQFQGGYSDAADTYIWRNTGWNAYQKDGKIETGNNLSAVTGQSAYTTGDVIGMAVDADNNTIKWYKNNTLVYTQNSPSLPASGWWMPAIAGFANYSGDSSLAYTYLNFGQDSSFAGQKTRQSNQDENGIGDFYYTPPSGYLALCSTNLPEDATFELQNGEKPSDHFDVVTYTGTSSTQSITGLDFQPDLVWVKNRSISMSHGWTDSIRGAGYTIKSDQSDAEIDYSAYFNSFNSNGFTVVSGGVYNNSGNQYVAMCWKAGGTPVSNTDGSITSQVSANTAAGFSIVTYTAGDSDETIGHGLSQAPEVVIVKRRDSAGYWTSLWNNLSTTNKQMYLNINGTLDTNNISDINSSTFRVSGWSDVVTSGGTYVSYCWHSVPGFSKIGEYTGNGSTNGPFVHTGFKPAFVIVKRYDGAAWGWDMYDNKRDPYNPVDGYLSPNSTDAENPNATYAKDFLSNGFKLRTSHDVENGSGSKYLYIAFAEDPFKYGNAR